MTLRFFRLLSVALIVSFVSPLWAQSTAGDEETIQSIKLADAPLETVLQLLEQWTGRTILRPQTLPTATYTLSIVRPMPKTEAIHALETILSMNQIGLSPMGDRFLKVVALAQTRTEAPEMLTGSALDLPPSGRVMSKVFQLDFLRVAEFIPQINTLLNPQMGGPVIFDKTNAALITDSVTNLQRVETLVRELDKPLTANLVPRFYTLRNGAKASDVVNKIRALFQGPLQGQLGSATSYSADDRTNQIILMADRRQFTLFDDLIAKLDVKADPNTRNEVIYLKHAASKDVASLLSQLVSGQNNAAKSAGGGSAVRPAPNSPPTPNTPNQPNAATPAPNLASLGLDSTTEFSSLITILPDERSNAVVVSGTVDDIRLIKELIDKIDVILAQVRIEVVIAEVTLNDGDKSGLAKLNLTFGQHDGVTRITNFTGDVNGFEISSGVVNPLSFVANLTDAGSKGDVKILSAPTIVTTHNKEAEIIVGESRPIITGSTSTPISAVTTTSTGFATSSQVTYKDIAIDLKVTPLIGDDGNIQLKIDQKVDDILDTVKIDNNDQPVIGRRQATSFVNVHDSGMIVLGGLQRTKSNTSRSKIGFLHEIPILSQILGSRTKGYQRTELLLFIRPHVIRPEEASADVQSKIQQQSNRKEINALLNPAAPAPEKK